MHDPSRLPPDIEGRCLDILEQSLDSRSEHIARLRDDCPEYSEAIRAWFDDATKESRPDTIVSPGEPERWLGSYRILHVLGSGSVGQVFLAEQTKPLQRQVAIKVVRAGLGDDETLARFEDERQMLAHLNHPNVAQVFDAGSTPDGQPYFSMEYVPGLPLLAFCREHDLDVRKRLAVLIQICRGVHHAHQKGIVHRDLKPHNVLVLRQDDRPLAKIIDFGLAKALGGASWRRAAPSRTGQIIGTLGYMSPEQAGLRGVTVDARADVYSLGAILYELLTDSTPFEEARLDSRPIDDACRIIREQEPLRPSELARRKSRGQTSARAADVPLGHRLIRGELDWIVLRAMAKEPARRYQSAMELGDDIERWLSGEPVRARPPSIWYESRKRLRRLRMPLAFLGAGLALYWVGLSSSSPSEASSVVWFKVPYRQGKSIGPRTADPTLLSSEDVLGVQITVPRDSVLVAFSLAGQREGEPDFVNYLEPEHIANLDDPPQQIDGEPWLSLSAGCNEVILSYVTPPEERPPEAKQWYEGVWIFNVAGADPPEWLRTWITKLRKRVRQEQEESRGITVTIAQNLLKECADVPRGVGGPTSRLDAAQRDDLRRACERDLLFHPELWPPNLHPAPSTFWRMVRD